MPFTIRFLPIVLHVRDEADSYDDEHRKHVRDVLQAQG